MHPLGGAELITLAHDQRDPRLAVVGLEREHVAADALRQVRLIQVPVVQVAVRVEAGEGRGSLIN